MALIAEQVRTYGAWSEVTLRMVGTQEHERNGKVSIHGGSKCLPVATQAAACAKPLIRMVPRGGVEPPTLRFSDGTFIEESQQLGANGVALSFVLGRYAGWALGDICHQPRSAWQDPRIAFIRRKKRKKRKLTDMQAPKVLAEALRKLAPDDNAPALVVNEAGEAYTENGLGTMIWKLNKDLADAGKVNMGLNIHGLRHSLGKQLYDLGLEREAGKAVMSHDSDAASIIYERDGNRAAKADSAVIAIDRSMRRRPTKKESIDLTPDRFWMLAPIGAPGAGLTALEREVVLALGIRADNRLGEGLPLIYDGDGDAHRVAAEIMRRRADISMSVRCSDPTWSAEAAPPKKSRSI